MSAKFNGAIICPVAQEWEEFKSEQGENMRSIAENNLKTAQILDRLETKLVNAATGKNHVPVSVVLVLISFLGFCLLGVVYKDSHMSIKLPWGGEITQGSNG